jgi:hypothetical protein
MARERRPALVPIIRSRPANPAREFQLFKRLPERDLGPRNTGLDEHELQGLFAAELLWLGHCATALFDPGGLSRPVLGACQRCARTLWC